MLYIQLFSPASKEGAVKISPDRFLTLVDGAVQNAWKLANGLAIEAQKKGYEVVNFERVYDFGSYTLYGYTLYCRKK